MSNVFKVAKKIENKYFNIFKKADAANQTWKEKLKFILNLQPFFSFENR